tara:strand:- start:11741 stop:12844 length:1104 start_codon:yes stop_codon:yes gene_type:complete
MEILNFNNKKMNVTVILPPPVQKPVGGYKIIYNYIKLLVSSNNSIKVNFLYLLNLPLKKKSKILNFLKLTYFNYIKSNFYNWFDFGDISTIKHSVGSNIKLIQNSDLIIVTAASTAIYFKELKIDKPTIYLIQHYEDWDIPVKNLVETYHYGYENVVVSSWLQNILKNNNSNVSLLIPNPVDDLFDITTPFLERNSKSIFFLFHQVKWKGCKELIESLKIVLSKFPETKISCFSATKKPANFPEWISFHYQPSREDLKHLYNQHSIFISSSYSEGYGLTPAEAMACGCVVITTDSGGVNDFAINNITAFMVDSPPNPEQISNKVFYIFNHATTANKISLNGHKKISSFSWSENLKKLTFLIDEKAGK